jgi:hypothetical protein
MSVPGSKTEVELADADFRFTLQRRHTVVCWIVRSVPNSDIATATPMKEAAKGGLAFKIWAC